MNTTRKPAASPQTDATPTASEKNVAGGDGGTRIVPYSKVLRQRQRDEGKKRKGERTRDSLKLAAIEVLGQVGYLDMRVSDICERAGASHAAFYLYFKDKNEITCQVLTEFLDDLFVQARVGQEAETAYEAFYAANLVWIRAVRANAGLMRCILQLSDETPEFKQLSEHNGYEWFAHVARTIARRFLTGHVEERVLLLTVYALGSMMDDFVRRLLVLRDPHLQKLVDSMTPTDESLAEFLTMLWHRAMFARDSQAAGYPVGRELEQIAASAAVAR